MQMVNKPYTELSLLQASGSIMSTQPPFFRIKHHMRRTFGTLVPPPKLFCPNKPGHSVLELDKLTADKNPVNQLSFKTKNLI